MTVLMFAPVDGGTLGFSGNSCVDVMNAWNLWATQAGGTRRIVNCDKPAIVSGQSFTLTYVDTSTGTSGVLTPTIRQMDSYQSIQGTSTYNVLMSMSPEEALVISMSIALVWAGAWGIRAIARSFINPDRSQEYE
ncbi:hypothetical protein [Noviherbaspirillum sp.]|uniref:hypothetical protein n=1 Tax=Noviherbaspirillum sp. TaxID=1926288 RepID=UPI002D52C1D2|nr:hypothetical protein [Noviherbaspirillum sp.]HZW23772.1 hypothetical protein [Noviherbaspirillum sp.]